MDLGCHLNLPECPDDVRMKRCPGVCWMDEQSIANAEFHL
ncbi:hypothetical protein DESC_880128 [Desulfosarcina cetonica]|nr:hypothetical protein DESC_880128 [Desulfosarcina cetonica]